MGYMSATRNWDHQLMSSSVLKDLADDAVAISEALFASLHTHINGKENRPDMNESVDDKTHCARQHTPIALYNISQPKRPYGATLSETILHGPYPQHFSPFSGFLTHPITRRRGIGKC